MQQSILSIYPIIKHYDVPVPIVEAIIEFESAWNPRALGDNGTSYGLFQLHTPGGQGDRAIKDGHKPTDLFDPWLNATYAMPAIASAWDNLKASFNASNNTWWLDFCAESGHPGGSRIDPSTQNAAGRISKIYNQLVASESFFELKGFPLKNQEAETDGNAMFDCVPESIAACLQWLTGKQFTGGQLKTAVYGKDYKGNQDAAAYMAFVASTGCRLTPYKGLPAQLVTEGHRQIALQHPVIITEKDPYSRDPHETHVLTWKAAGAGWLRAMDTMGGIEVSRTDEDWASNWLRSGTIWICEKIGPVPQPAPAHELSSDDKSEILASLAFIKDSADHISGIISKISV